MTNEFTKELLAITQYAIASDTVNTENKVRKMLQELLDAPIYELSNGQTMECEEDKIKEECKKTYSLLFKDRKELVKSFEKWCKDANADKYSQENVIAWMQIKGLLDTKSVKEFLEEIKDE